MNWVAHIGRRARPIKGHDADTIRRVLADPQVRDRAIQQTFNPDRCDFDADPPVWVGLTATFGKHTVTPSTTLSVFTAEEGIVLFRTEPPETPAAGTNPTRSALTFDVVEDTDADGPFPVVVVRWDTAVYLDVAELEFGPARGRIGQIMALIIDIYIDEALRQASQRVQVG